MMVSLRRLREGGEEMKQSWFEPRITEIEVKTTEMAFNKTGCDWDEWSTATDGNVLGEKEPCVGCS